MRNVQGVLESDSNNLSIENMGEKFDNDTMKEASENMMEDRTKVQLVVEY